MKVITGYKYWLHVHTPVSRKVVVEDIGREQTTKIEQYLQDNQQVYVHYHNYTVQAWQWYDQDEAYDRAMEIV